LLEASVAVHENGVVPSPNVEPEGGAQTWVTPGQLSETMGFNATLAPLGPVHSTTGLGHVMFGFC